MKSVAGLRNQQQVPKHEEVDEADDSEDLDNDIGTVAVAEAFPLDEDDGSLPVNSQNMQMQSTGCLQDGMGILWQACANATGQEGLRNQWTPS